MCNAILLVWVCYREGDGVRGEQLGIEWMCIRSLSDYDRSLMWKLFSPPQKNATVQTFSWVMKSLWPFLFGLPYSLYLTEYQSVILGPTSYEGDSLCADYGWSDFFLLCLPVQILFQEIYMTINHSMHLLRTGGEVYYYGCYNLISHSVIICFLCLSENHLWFKYYAYRLTMWIYLFWSNYCSWKEAFVSRFQ